MPDDHRRPCLPWPRSRLVPAGKVGRGHLHRPVRPQPDRHHPGVDPGRGNGERHRPPFPDPPNRSAGRSRLPVTRSSGDPWHPTSARHPASTATAPTTRQRRLPGRPIAAAKNPTRRRVLRPRARGTWTHRTWTRRTWTRGTRTCRCRVPRWGTLPPPRDGARRAVHNLRPGEPVPTSGRDPPQGCGCARQSTSPCGRNGGGWRSPGAPAARAVAAGGRDQQDGEDEGGADEGQAGGVVGAGDGAAEAGVDALRGRDRVVGG
jgi:hypothetical protein